MDLCFGEGRDGSGQAYNRLFTIGKDKFLFEYNIKKSSKELL